MPLKGIDRLILVRVKVERAKKHLRDLEDEIVVNRDQCSSVFIENSDSIPSGPQQLTTPLFPARIPRLPWNAIATAGDLVHNLRSALDHLAYQLATVGTPGTEPSRRVEFPIAKDVATYESEKAKKIQGMKPEVVKAIDDLQPYKGGRNGDLLWRIHELDNLNKHRTHFTVAHDYILYADWIGDYLVRGKPQTSQFVTLDSFDINVQENLQQEVETAIEDASRRGEALLPFLRQLVGYVENLIECFLPFLHN
jgi:hypothetical protein